MAEQSSVRVFWRPLLIVGILAAIWGAFPGVPLLLYWTDPPLHPVLGWSWLILFPALQALWPAAVLGYWRRASWPLWLTLGVAVLLSLMVHEAAAAIYERGSRGASDPLFEGEEWYILFGGVSLAWGVAIGVVQHALSRLQGPGTARTGVILLSGLAAPTATAANFTLASLLLWGAGGGHAGEFFQLQYGLAIPAGIGVGLALAVAYAAVAEGLGWVFHRGTP